MGLIRNLFWFVIFLGSTFAFTVLFEHGPTNFVENSKKEYQTILKTYGGKVERKDDTSHTLGH